MNCISGSGARSLPLALVFQHRWALLLALIAVAACGVETSESADSPVERDYDAHYSVRFDPADSAAEVSLEIRQSRSLLRELNFPSVSSAQTNFSGDGDLQISNGALRWLPPAKGGTLRWRVQIAHRRGENTYDAWLSPDWGMFRAEDIIPRARTRSLEGSKSKTTLSFDDMPMGWSAVTEYSSIDDPISIKRSDRRFDQPTGWVVVGNIGVRREIIAGVRVAIAAPEGQAVRRMDMLALLNWTLPELVGLLGQPLTRLTVVSAGEPMWRGGLSAPASLYIHADRPLISENATSTLLHEVMHTALSLRTGADADWIAEGLAEYYSLELLKRGGAISVQRYKTAIADQVKWANKAETLCAPTSTGPRTALAVTVLHALNEEIREKTAGASDLDELLRRVLATQEPIDVTKLTEIATDLIGEPSDALHIDKLPGCPRMTPADNSD